MITVLVRILPGNHDEHASVAVAYYLLALYRNEPRVTVDIDPSLFWWYRFGSVFLGATHGHTVKMNQMPMIMASRKADDWGKSKFRHIHTFHIHHSSKVATEGDGCICESHKPQFLRMRGITEPGFFRGAPSKPLPITEITVKFPGRARPS